MIKRILFSILFTVTIASTGFAQDTLPSISVIDLSGKIIVSWKNNFGARISTINIQRSSDSIKNFTTIGSVLDPTNRSNGFVDSKSPAANLYYRVFVAFEGGTYLFSKSHRPEKDSINQSTNLSGASKIISGIPGMPDASTTISKPGIGEDPAKKNVPRVWVPSSFIYTGKDNNVIINLPDVKTKKYSVKFFDADEFPVLEISKIKEPFLILEKVNFLHAGWFNFNLYENGELIERQKLFIAKEGN